MDDANYLNIQASARDKYIYRIISVQRLLELFETKKNVLVEPQKWDDPFENFILRSRIRLPTGDLTTLGFRDSFYGQCWTLHRASDAMWRIYSQKSNAVRIRSTVRRVAEGLSRALGGYSQAEVFIGRMQYLPSGKLMEFARSTFRGHSIPSARMLAKTLLVKRPAFRHEREVRLLCFQRAEPTNRGGLFRYTVDPHEIIDQIMIDPRMPEQDAVALRRKIRAETGFRAPIKRSLLYAPPPELVLPLGILDPIVDDA